MRAVSAARLPGWAASHGAPCRALAPRPAEPPSTLLAPATPTPAVPAQAGRGAARVPGDGGGAAGGWTRVGGWVGRRAPLLACSGRWRAAAVCGWACREERVPFPAGGAACQLPTQPPGLLAPSHRPAPQAFAEGQKQQLAAVQAELGASQAGGRQAQARLRGLEEQLLAAQGECSKLNSQVGGAGRVGGCRQWAGSGARGMVSAGRTRRLRQRRRQHLLTPPAHPESLPAHPHPLPARWTSWSARRRATAPSWPACAPCTTRCRASTPRVSVAAAWPCWLPIQPACRSRCLPAEACLPLCHPPRPARRAVCGQLTAAQQQQEAALDRLQRLAERLALTQQEKVSGGCGCYEA